MWSIPIVVLAFLLSAPSSALSLEEAQHFLLRTGFGASPADIDHLLPVTREQAVDSLLAGIRTEPLTPPPTWATGPAIVPFDYKNATTDQRIAFNAHLADERRELKAWWYREMIATPSPFTEHMTLAWHNHFTSGFEKVSWPVLMYRQNLLLRHYALGNFRDFLLAIAQDPAMILYLDTQSNRKGHPNENFARELMELFTLGEGNYSETDVQEAARAFTGWQVEMTSGTVVYRPYLHDENEKNFQGKSGYFHADSILYILLTKPRVSEFITQKLWREFISDSPDPAEVRRLGSLFRENDYELRPLIRALLLEPAFWDPSNFGTMTKSPVELMVGTIRTFNSPVDDANPLVITGRALGQDLFDPPNVKGWPGSKWWITTQTMLLRRQFLAQLLRGQDMASRSVAKSSTTMMTPQSGMARSLDLNQWMGQVHMPTSDNVFYLTKLLLAVPPVEADPPRGDALQAIRALIADPAYQVK